MNLKTKQLMTLLLMLCIGFAFYDFFITSWHFITVNRFPRVAQTPFLVAALTFKHLSASYVYDGNLHPFYMMLLSTFASRSSEFFTWAKFFSLVILLGTASVFYRITRKYFSPIVSGLAFFVLLSNWTLLAVSYQLRPEILLIPFFFGAWYATIQGFQDARWWLLAGACAGFSYLTKGTGLLLPISFLLTLIWIYRLDWRRIGTALCWYGLPFLIVSAPLCWLNIRTFGAPFYNWSIRHAMWLNQWEGFDHLQQLPDMKTFFQTNSIGTSVAREIQGIGKFLPVFLSIFYPSRFFFVGFYLFWAWMVAFAVGFLLNIQNVWKGVCERSSEDFYFFRYTVVLVGIFFFLFAWYQQVSSSERFVMPLIIPCFFLVARLTDQFYRESLSRWAASGNTVLIALVCIVSLQGLSVGIKTVQWKFPNPFMGDQIPAWASQSFSWIHQEPAGAVVAFTGNDYLPTWLSEPPLARMIQIKNIQNEQMWLAFLRDSKACHVLFIEPESITTSPYLQQFVEIRSDEEWGIRQAPPRTQLRKQVGDYAYWFEVLPYLKEEELVASR